MIFSKKLRKTAASVLALVMVFAMSTGAFAYGGLQDSTDDNSDGYYTVTVSYTVEDLGEDLPDDAQISIIALAGTEDANAEVKHENNTATNVLWIDQQAVNTAGGSFTFQVNATDAASGFNIKSGVTGGQTMTGYVEIAAVEPDTDPDPNPGEGDDDDTTGEAIPDANITIGGKEIGDSDGQISASTPVTGNKIYNEADKHIVRVELEPVIVGDVVQAPTKVVAHNGKTDGIETFYTEYPTGPDGAPVIKLVTIITDPSLSASELTLVDAATAGKTLKKITYGDMNSDGDINGTDVGAIIPQAKKLTLTTIYDKLTADINGDGTIDGTDVGIYIPTAKKYKIPTAAEK